MTDWFPIGTAPKTQESAGNTLRRLGVDGARWAAEFRETALEHGYSDMDEGWLIGWFCNAIMAGYDYARGNPPLNGDHAQFLKDTSGKATEQ